MLLDFEGRIVDMDLNPTWIPCFRSESVIKEREDYIPNSIEGRNPKLKRSSWLHSQRLDPLVWSPDMYGSGFGFRKILET